jgi:hypothetical protein
VRGVKSRVLSHVAMKVTSKKKRARTSSSGRKRVRDKGQGSCKITGMRSVSKRRGTPLGAGSGKARHEERRRKANQRKTKEMKTPAAAVKPGTGPVSSVPVPGHEPESRGAPPPLPTPIASFNI